MKLSSVVKLSRARVIIRMFLVLLGLWLVIALRNPRRGECTRQLSLACIPVVTALGPVVRRATVSEVDRPVGETRLASEIFPAEKIWPRRKALTNWRSPRSLAAPEGQVSDPRPLDGVRRNSRQGNFKYQARRFLRPPRP